MNYNNLITPESVVQAEQSVLGSLFLLGDMTTEQAQKILFAVKPAMFTQAWNREIFNAIKVYQNSNIDLITIENYLERHAIGDPVPLAYIAEVCKNTASAANAMAYVRIMRDFAITRTTIQTLNRGLAIANDPEGLTPTEVLGTIESLISNIRSRAVESKSNGLLHMSEIGERWSTELEKRFNGEGFRGVTTGFAGLDKILTPKNIPAGALVAVGARPKMGKTSFMLGWAEHISINLNMGNAIFSLEMPDDQLYERMIAAKARINSNIFYEDPSKTYDFDFEFAKASEAIGTFNNSNCFIDDTSAVTLSYIKAESRRLHKKLKQQGVKLGAVMVDYLTLMKGEEAERRDLSYGEVTKGLKELAKELDCVVVLLTQLNRNLESRADKRPMPSDSKDTGQIEQDCDVWIGLYRDSVYHPDSPTPPDLTEAIVRLNRNGNTGTAHLSLKNGYLTDFLGEVNFENTKQRRYANKNF